ncbi:hypothetical protein JCM19302_1480 [Jejuia pallidilutea]|uniref:Uncharacterized protein n=1 Tax=Jejuia pallidilutea TaxID=504487 RepID=A0A090W0Z3_9FLAO|nr:hypothetical protein JCM19302_1480 [Jejuia pallidilutea]
MFDNFLFNVEYGVKHVLDINAYDHVFIFNGAYHSLYL